VIELTIDFGTTRTKVAAYDREEKKASLIELGREIHTIIPSTFYIPREGEILVGDDAEEAISDNPAGIVRGLK
jgi:molecular chaperone DnaK (HSP70)